MNKILISLIIFLPIFDIATDYFSGWCIASLMRGKMQITGIDCPTSISKDYKRTSKDTQPTLSILPQNGSTPTLSMDIFVDNATDTAFFFDMRFFKIEYISFSKNWTNYLLPYYKAWTNVIDDVAYIYIPSRSCLKTHVNNILPLCPKEISNAGDFEVNFNIIIPKSWHNKSPWIWYNDLVSNKIFIENSGRKK